MLSFWLIVAALIITWIALWSLNKRELSATVRDSGLAQ